MFVKFSTANSSVPSLTGPELLPRIHPEDDDGAPDSILANLLAHSNFTISGASAAPPSTSGGGGGDLRHSGGSTYSLQGSTSNNVNINNIVHGGFVKYGTNNVNAGGGTGAYSNMMVVGAKTNVKMPSLVKQK